jgi:hypothetical protein
MNLPRRTRIVALVGIAAIVVVASAFYDIHKLQSSRPSNSTAASTPTLTTSKAQSQLIADLSHIAPQFVDDTEARNTPAPLPAYLHKIKTDLTEIMFGPGPHDPAYGVTLTLIAIGKRYEVFILDHPTDTGSLPIIFDLITGNSVGIPGLYQFTVGDTAVYVSATDICTYTLDQPSCVELPGAKLPSGEITPGSEVYGDDQGLAGYFTAQDLSHTSTTLTIALPKWPQFNNDQNGPNEPQKIKDVTFVLPQ